MVCYNLFPMEIDFNNLGPSSFDCYEDIYNQLAKETFLVTKRKDNFLIDVTIVNNEEIHKINKTYRGIDRPTDVISFAFYDDENETYDENGVNPLGSIIISYEKGISQAEDYGHSLKREMSFLFVHGLLHLLGYDHMKEEDEKIMFSLQDEILGGRFDD